MSDALANETQTAVEQLLLRKNGERKTVADVFELLLAVHHDAQNRDLAVLERLQEHCVEADVRDERLEALEGWRHEQATTCEHRVMQLIEKEHGKRHDAYVASIERAPRRKDDPPDADFRDLEDNEIGDMRRAWRVVRWAVAAACVPVLVALGNELSMRLFGN